MPSLHRFHLIRSTDARYSLVLKLRDAVLRRPLGLSLYNEDLSAERDEYILIATDEQESVIGCLMLRPLADGLGRLRQMAVSTDQQGRGLGAKIMLEIEGYARALGVRRLAGHARMYALPFYLKLGYTTTGEAFEEVGIPHIAIQKDIA